MTPVSLALLGALAPEYATMDEARLAVLNQVAAIHVSDAVFGEHAAVATAYVIAHLAKLGDTGGAGAVRSESVGDVSRTYAAAADSAGYWDLTSYGQEFKRLCSQIALVDGDLFVAPPASPTPEA